MDLQYILIPLIVVILTQIIKLSIDTIRGNLTIKNIFLSYGGMPSAHTAFSVSITTLLGLRQGISSPIFAVSLVFTLIVMRDAATFRNILGKQGKYFNEILQLLPKDKRKHLPHFQERIGHSVSEIFFGALWGIISTVILAFLLFPAG